MIDRDAFLVLHNALTSYAHADDSLHGDEAAQLAAKLLQENADRIRAAQQYECPWCGSKAEPVPTIPDVAELAYSDKRDPEVWKRNPAMCETCHGVGGWADFRVLESARE